MLEIRKKVFLDGKKISIRVKQAIGDVSNAVKEISENGIKLASKDISDSRLEICLSCEFIVDRSRCSKCGCFMKLKTKLSNYRCPIGKWEREKERD